MLIADTASYHGGNTVAADGLPFFSGRLPRGGSIVIFPARRNFRR
jgi:hypothetical protein